MIHAHELPRPRGLVKARVTAGPSIGAFRRSLAVVRASPVVRMSAFVRASAVVALLVVSSCDGGSTAPEPTLFGEIGHIQVDVVSRLDDDRGVLTESLIWQSNGLWALVESVAYRGIQGSERARQSRLNPGDLVAEYASLVRQLSETQGLRLLGGGASQDVLPSCDPSAGEPGTRVAFTIRDEFRGETARWVRCANGSLLHPQNSIAPGDAWPDAEAARVITAAQLTRFFTLGEAAESTYTSTIAFGTLDRGEHSPALPAQSRVFHAPSGVVPGDFVNFWRAHAGQAAPLPFVDWTREIVLLAAVGERTEAGDVVGVRRVLGIGSFTRVELVERVPGNFCAPKAQRGYPYHLIVLPAIPIPVEFTPPQVERVPCGS